MTLFEHVPLAAQPVQAWANGGGSTRQVAIEPRDGSLARGFRWRVSIAQVASSGPFSHLPGVDRSLWLLRGDGVQLALHDGAGGRTVVLDRALQRFDFAGETAVACTLLGGACEDCNVMTARDRIVVDAHMHRLGAGGELAIDVVEQGLVVALNGAFTANGAIVVNEREALCVREPCRIPVLANEAGALLLVAKFGSCG
jgi:environmental stress-induced protein Ves